MNKHDIQALIEIGMPEAQVEVTGDDGQHFEALVISSDFEGKRLLQRHQQVYACLGEKMGHEIHALRLATMTPAEAQQKSSQEQTN
ncbi:MAG: BolA/IbaG family iron-sulfur metabolism protein [Gammaproteobacteria bacterium]|nr:BolA/IbaG family iron-sulfur metabolism protein [Gammaproteobacteria bacterium]NNC97309.1 BolA/IbaG family iron-sulfur metabolism protein [Gammaproteobacteria bacterium]